MSGDAVTKLMLGTAAVIDVETTGLNPHRDEIVELAITLFRYDRVKGQVLEVVSEYSGLREPSCPIRRDATAVHGITRRMVQVLRGCVGRPGLGNGRSRHYAAHGARAQIELPSRTGDAAGGRLSRRTQR
jgi:hypothetical protein